MADLDSLIRLKRHNVEEKQKVLADLFRQIERFEAKKEELLARLQKEREALEENLSLETREYYGRFEGVIRTDIERIDAEVAKLETRLTIAQDEMRDAFADMKRVEIVHRRRQEEEASEIKNKESGELDEIGIEGFRRKGE
ncbi:MAG: flagellar FliJ family protein [Alphaproteobacteria bacterium]|nr:flagellar FliJ family protein [Alphaproteobacteria bacterium]